MSWVTAIKGVGAAIAKVASRRKTAAGGTGTGTAASGANEAAELLKKVTLAKMEAVGNAAAIDYKETMGETLEERLRAASHAEGEDYLKNIGEEMGAGTGTEEEVRRIKLLVKLRKLSPKEAMKRLRLLRPTKAGAKKALKAAEPHAKKFLKEAGPGSLMRGGVFTVIFSGILIFLIFFILFPRIADFNPYALFGILTVIYGGIFFAAHWSKR